MCNICIYCKTHALPAWVTTPSFCFFSTGTWALKTKEYRYIRRVEIDIYLQLVDNLMWCCWILKYLVTLIYMLISYSRNEKELTSSSLWMSLCRWMIAIGQRWNRTTAASGALMAWCSGKGGDKMEMRLSDGESRQDWDDLFIAVEGWSRTVLGVWPMTVEQIQYLNFGSRGKATGWNITRRWNGVSELILTPWKGSMTQRDSMTTSAGGEAAPGRKKRGDDVSWPDTNLTRSK
jgi:hypothetical protein